MDEATIENGFEKLQLLPAKNDDHGGVVVELKEHMDSDVFLTLLKTSMSQWTIQGKKGVCIRIPIHLVNLVGLAVKEGFCYQHAEPDYLMLVKWITKTASTIPANTSHRVGIGAVVSNDKREGEDTSNGVIRKVKEETRTGIPQFGSIFSPVLLQAPGCNQPPGFPTNPSCYPSQTSQIQSQPQSPNEDGTPKPSRLVKSSRSKSSKKTATPTPTRTGPAPPQIWTKTEEAALASAWINVSEEDASTATQTVVPSWKRVTELFHNAMGREEYRTHHQINSKWRDLNRKVGKFNTIYINLLNERTSDHSEAGILRAALDQYRSEQKGAAFNHISAWEVLRKSSKWTKVPQIDHPTSGPDHPTSGPKRTKTSDSNEYTNTTSSDAHCYSDLNDEDDVIEPEEPQRLTQTDKGKRAESPTLLGSSTDEKIDRLVDRLDKFTSSYDQHLELEKEKFRRKEKAREEKIRAQNEAREVEDFKILTANTDHLSGPALLAALALKDKIAKRYGFE